MEYSFIDSAEGLGALLGRWSEEGVNVVAMDFEEESNLHCYGEHLCTIQLYDRRNYYILDALALSKVPEGLNLIKAFLEGPVEKIMFACQSDASIARKTLSIQLDSIFDVRVIAMALGFNGNLTTLIQRNLGLEVESTSMKKRYQTANWMRRPIPKGQIEYALGDVQYLFELKDSLVAEMQEKLPRGKQKQLLYDMKKCAVQKNPERPGWEKICNFKLLAPEEKIYIKHFFLARDALARKANVPATRILEKHLIVSMAKRGTWDGVLKEDKLRYRETFEKARLDALKELKGA